MPKSVTFALPARVDQHVLRLDVAMDEAFGVGAGEAAADLDRIGDGFVDGQGPEPADPVLEGLARHVFEDDVGVAGVLARVDHLDDVRMREPGYRARLAPETLELVGLVGYLAVQDLDRDLAVESLVDAEVDGRHAAAAELRLEPVAAGHVGSDHDPILTSPASPVTVPITLEPG